MALRIPNGAEALLLEILVNKTAAQNLVLRLFKNDVTPADTDTVSNYTEADFTGYSAVTLTGANWTATPGDPTEIAYAQQSFTSSAGSQNQTIYGYYLTRATGGELIIAERFGTSYTIQNNGDTIKVTPKITGQDTAD
jgi:hypothetical protein